MGADAGPRVRPGAATAAVAVVGLLTGAATGYRMAHHSPSPRIILRQSSDGPVGFDTTGQLTTAPGSTTQVGVAVRNDGATAVEVVGASLAGQAAVTGPPAPTVDIPPNGGVAYVVIAFPSPNRCGNIASDVSHPVRITVFARAPGGDTQQIPVDVTGTTAAVLAACGL